MKKKKKQEFLVWNNLIKNWIKYLKNIIFILFSLFYIKTFLIMFQLKFI